MITLFRRLLPLFAFAALAHALPAGYGFCATFTIDHTKIPNTDQTNYPVLVNGYASAMQIVTSGGQMQNVNGYDIQFYSDAGYTTTIPYERSLHNTSVGVVLYWVQVPTVSHTSDTSFYGCWGNASITTDQSTPNAVWDPNYKAVWHLTDNTTSTNVSDSTSNAHTGQNFAPTNLRTAVGELPNVTALNYPQTNQIPDLTIFNSPSGGDFDFTSGNFTFELWTKTTSVAADASFFGNSFLNSVGYIFQDNGSGNGAYAFTVSNGNYHVFGDTTANSNNVWRHVVYTRNGTTLLLYVNGALRHTFSSYVNASSSNNLFTLAGTGGQYGAAYMKGSLQEFRVSNSTRSADYITAQYNNQSSPSTFFTVFPWDQTSHIPPTCNAGSSQSVRAGGSITLDGSGSAHNFGSTLTYLWQYVPSAEPGVPLQSTLSWDDHTIVGPTVSNIIGGPANFQLIVTQSDGQSSSCVVHDGGVATDMNGNVSIPDARISQLLGPLTMLGSPNNTLPLLDTLHKAWADLMSSKQGLYITPWLANYNTQYPYWSVNVIPGGLVSCTNGSKVCTVSGFNPETTYCNGGTTWDGHSYPIILYTYPLSGGGTIKGHYLSPSVNAITCSTTSFTLPDNFLPATEGNMPIAVANLNNRPEIVNWYVGNNGSHQNTFYESPNSYYSLYYRTGIDLYLNYGRWLSDQLWQTPEIDMGNSDYGTGSAPYFLAPRMTWGRALWIRALDQDAVAGSPGSSLMWPGLGRIATVVMHNSLVTSSTAVLGGSTTDLREMSFQVLAIALCAIYDPNSGNRATCSSDINSWIGGIVTSNRKPEPDGKSAWWMSSTDCDVAVRTVANVGFCATANLASNIRATMNNGDTTVTFGPGNVLQLSWGIWDGSNQATFWRADNIFDPSTWDAASYTITYVSPTSATLSVPYSGSACSGGCKFLLSNDSKNLFGPQYLSLMEGIFGNALYFSHLALAANGYPTNDALAVQYISEVANELLNFGYNAEYKALGYASKGVTANPTLGAPMIYPICTGAAYPHFFSCTQSKVQDRELPESYKTFSYSYMLNPDSTLLSNFDSLLSYCFNSSLDGTYCSGFAVGGSFWLLGEEKYLGAFYSTGGTETWMSARQGGLSPPVNLTTYVDFTLSSVPNATKIVVTPTDMSGTVQSTVTCTTSPCAVTLNSVAGAYQLKIQYQSGSSAVLRTGAPFLVVLQ